MKLIHLLAILSLALFTSCSDSPENLVDDQISFMEEMTELIEEVADGKTSSADAAEQIKEWGEKGEKLQERMKALRKEDGAEEAFKDAGKKHEERSKKAMKDFFSAMQKLQKSGRMTKELQEAIRNVK